MELLLLIAVTLQVIQVNQTEPCFLNYSAGHHMLENCGYDDDYLTAALAPWTWVTGGFFPVILVSILTLGTYIKYHTAIYPLIIGLIFLPVSYFAFPDSFITFAFLMMGAVTGIMIWYAFIHQTKDF
jgi:hypothetical protein